TLSAREAEDRLLDRLDPDLESAHLLLGAETHRLLVEKAEPGQWRRSKLLASEEEVPGDVEVVGKREILLDGLDPHRSRLPRRGNRHRLAVEQQLSGVRLVDAGDDLD